LKVRANDVSGSEKASVMRRLNTLEERIRLRRQYSRAVGVWRIGTVFYTECAEQVELLSHGFLKERLDKLAPFGEVFCCSVSEAREAIEGALSQLGLYQSARREDSILKGDVREITAKGDA